MAQTDAEVIRSYLQSSGPNGATLYDHLSKVLLVLSRDKQANALDQLEAISSAIKQGGVKDFKQVANIKLDAEGELAVIKQSKENTKLIKPIPKEGEELPEPVPTPDFMRQAELFSAVGCGFAREEIFKLSLSVSRLATAQELLEVRIFGKIYGVNKDYYIVEAKMSSWPEEDDGEESRNESWGAGANSHAYFVTNNLLGKWDRLPRVQPHMIILARKMRHFFTGDLNAKVYGFPRFTPLSGTPWTEKDFLRAQIARITASTLVGPKGLYVVGEDDSVSLDEEFRGVPFAELLRPEGWTHYRPHLLKQGRVEPFIPPEKDEADEGDEPAEPAEVVEEALPPLGVLSTDSSPTLPNVWSFRQSGGPAAHQVASTFSNIWPGAVAVAKKSENACLYIGFGQRYLSNRFSAPPPAPFQTEYVAKYNEANEENPLKEQVDPQPPADFVEKVDEAPEKKEGDGEEEEEEDGIEEAGDD